MENSGSGFSFSMVSPRIQGLKVLVVRLTQTGKDEIQSQVDKYQTIKELLIKRQNGENVVEMLQRLNADEIHLVETMQEDDFFPEKINVASTKLYVDAKLNNSPVKTR